MTHRTLHRLAAIAACAGLWTGFAAPADAQPGSAPSAPAPAPSPAPPSSSPSQASPANGARAAHDVGVAVVALDGAADVAWPFAQAIYGAASIRPAGLDEARARILAGEPPLPDAPPALRDLAETRAAIHGDDAPSRQLLAGIASSLHVKAIVVVEPASPPALPSARVFLADAAAFDALRYAPDATSGDGTSWRGAVASLERTYGALPPPAPLADVRPRDDKRDTKGGSKASFFSSPWFWGAIGAAAFGGAAVYLATRDNDPGTIHLQMQVPK